MGFQELDTANPPPLAYKPRDPNKEFPVS